MTKYIWLDADPGHDDAIAILLALHLSDFHLLGISTTHGNTSSHCTSLNAARCLHAFGADRRIRVYPGASKPLLLPVKYDAEIHGEDGLGGVEGLLPQDDPALLDWFEKDSDGKTVRALEGMVRSIRETWNNGAGHKVHVVSTGPMTNIALFVSAYPDLLTAIEEFVFMGGGVGVGNRSPSAEWNILCDPHAAQIVLDAPVKKTMMPLNVTHTAIVTRDVHARLLSTTRSGTENNNSLPPASTKLRHMLSTLVTFFADSYKSTFGFKDGPPLHDALTIAYIAFPDLFKTARYRVDIELTGAHTIGETVVDVWHYRPCDLTWGPSGRNCLVAESVEVNQFFEIFLQCVERCDVNSPLNVSR